MGPHAPMLLNISNTYTKRVSYKKMQLVDNSDRFDKKDYVRQLDNNITSIGKDLLIDVGTVSHEEAMEKAVAENRVSSEDTIIR